jgi:hypothetical protein
MAALLAFARFLGLRWLAANYRWEADGLALRLPWVKAGFLTNMSGFFVPISPRCSRLLLRTDADVAAHLGEVDAAHLAALFPGDPGTPEELELHIGVTSGSDLSNGLSGSKLAKSVTIQIVLTGHFGPLFFGCKTSISGNCD